MNDRELLELAAKAAGDETYDGQDGHLYLYVQEDQWYGPSRVLKRWNPLEDDGDALRLAIKLGVMVWRDGDVIHRLGGHDRIHEGECQYAVARRAIVRAAAEIGKAMEGGEK